MMIEALMYGMIPKAMIEAFVNPPPEKTDNNVSNKF
jgi:hypothetical protein